LHGSNIVFVSALTLE